MTKKKIILTENQINFIQEQIRASYPYFTEIMIDRGGVPHYSPLMPVTADISEIPSYEDTISLLMAEGISKSFPADKVMSYIKRHFKDSVIKIQEDATDYEKAKILVLIPADNVIKDKVTRAMALCGYYLATSFSPPQYPALSNDVWLQFEPRYNTEIFKEIKSHERFLIHLTPETHVEKILKQGLVPRSKNRLLYYPERIYFLRGSTPPQVIHELYENISMVYNFEKNDPTWRYAGIFVDVNKLPDDTRVFIDPNFSEYGLYTLDNIHPNAIVDVKYIKQKTK